MASYNVYVFILIIVVYALAVPHNVYAYLDAGTGSYLIQLAIAFIAGGIFMVKVYWQRLRLMLSRGRKAKIAPTPSAAEESEKSLEQK
ncbi:hypothetical protein A2477_03890 [Candidatus Falkowbacteria bacterium RIFOXYC2_FULL_47_12]|uniref:Uncharacterized protein n=2 Tax=Candidatus Falkowiibacteriota TaxID=1752728 RepID=A0A1F5TNX5_9BACT|nr:MAG: hypothetical protein A2242_04490 [Candidatus Falkowbacteria bacterium RIFOXYA2_FULL_47_9]OGF40616.1 MAG: hypothetical protein A2477_03890 [Candidatus Falkowbacteria bacterium RIFOXYC2_FULL_47_12]